jgi:hypothetical protein
VLETVIDSSGMTTNSTDDIVYATMVDAKVDDQSILTSTIFESSSIDSSTVKGVLLVQV